MFTHTGIGSINFQRGIGTLDCIFSKEKLTSKETRESLRSELIRHYRLGPADGVVFAKLTRKEPNGFNAEIPDAEFTQLLTKHEHFMGLSPHRIFLSHKGTDKPLVRDFHKTLKDLGFDPWLDEDAMIAGANRERAILDGFNQSCAAIFFITPNFVDENYLATEIDYAIDQKREKGDKFAIITLSFSDGDKNGTVPQLLKSRYIFKEPSTHLEALREILRALPLQLGSASWRF